MGRFPFFRACDLPCLLVPPDRPRNASCEIYCVFACCPPECSVANARENDRARGGRASGGPLIASRTVVSLDAWNVGRSEMVLLERRGGRGGGFDALAETFVDKRLERRQSANTFFPFLFLVSARPIGRPGERSTVACMYGPVCLLSGCSRPVGRAPVKMV